MVKLLPPHKPVYYRGPDCGDHDAHDSEPAAGRVRAAAFVLILVFALGPRPGPRTRPPPPYQLLHTGGTIVGRGVGFCDGRSVGIGGVGRTVGRGVGLRVGFGVGALASGSR